MAARPGEIRCPHCGSWNAEDEHRCRYCQHRLKPEGPPHQGLLFGPTERPKVIPFESIAPGRAVVPPGHRSASRSSASRMAGGAQSRPRTPSAQQNLDLVAPPARLRPAPQPAVYCEAPIATRLRRFAAAAVDALFVLLGLGLFLATFHVLGGRLVLDRAAAPYYGGIALALALLYKSVWSIAGGDSLGLQFVRLRLLNFDGQPPTVRQRVLRLVGACISVSALGCGLLWALLDREKLTWHDHISATFLTVNDARRGPARRQ